jgi:hypothetical protein
MRFHKDKWASYRDFTQAAFIMYDSRPITTEQEPTEKLEPWKQNSKLPEHSSFGIASVVSFVPYHNVKTILQHIR